MLTVRYFILPVHGHNPSRAAVPTLGTVEVSQSALYLVVPLGSVADAFHGHHLEPMTRVHGKHALQRTIKLRPFFNREIGSSLDMFSSNKRN